MASPTALAPEPPNLRVGRIVHVHQRQGSADTPCIPAIVWGYQGTDASVTILAYNLVGSLVSGISHEPDPRTGIVLLGGNVPPTWHWPQLCPWDR